jgi:uncharacterized protein YqeY
MTLSEQLTADLGDSMKAGNSAKTGVLRLLKSSLKNEQIKLGHELGNDEVLKVLQREAKQRRDSIDQYQTAGRSDLVAIEEAELAIIQTYLPQAMSPAELEQVVDEVIAQVGATDAKQMGAVIGGVMQRVGARAEGGTVSQLVRSKLGA